MSSDPAFVSPSNDGKHGQRGTSLSSSGTVVRVQHVLAICDMGRRVRQRFFLRMAAREIGRHTTKVELTSMPQDETIVR